MEDLNKKNSDRIVLKLTDVSKNFGRRNAVSKMNFSLESGTVFALLGENGAGKTTTIKMLFGLTRPNAGSIRVLGLDPTKEKEALEIRRRVGYVPDQPIFYDYLRVGEMGKFAAAFYPDRYWQEYLRLLETFSIAPDLKIASLSRGMKALVSLALALANDPDLLILDEPTSGLDPIVRRSFLQSMADRTALGKSVFLSSHQITEVERIADRIGIMRQSELMFDESLETLKNEIRQLVLTFHETAPYSAPDHLFDSVIQYAPKGRTAVITGKNLHNDFTNHLSESVVTHEILSPDLEDIFIALARRNEQYNIIQEESKCNK